MNADARHALPPKPIIAMARKRIAQLTADHFRDDRPWYVRMLVQKTTSMGYAYPMVVAEWFAHFDVSTHRCSGECLGCWCIDAESVMEPSREEPRNGPGKQVVVIYFSFALARDRKSCVVVEVYPSGLMRRGMYELPDGIDSESLGVPRGNILEERIDLKAWDPMPPG